MESKNIVFACDKCKFISVNKRRYELHALNHDYGKTKTTMTVGPVVSVDNAVEIISSGAVKKTATADDDCEVIESAGAGTPKVNIIK